MSANMDGSRGAAAADERGAALLDAARSLAPRIAALADEIERERRLPRPLVDALVEAGLFRMLVPASLGGAEVHPLTFARVLEEIARADGSSGWCVGQGAGSAPLPAVYLDRQAAAHIFRDPRTVIARGTDTGAAIPVAGGYRLTGRWLFASGIHHATWLCGIAAVAASDGSPRQRADGGVTIVTLLFPASAAEITDVWHVSGLRGTGSDTYAVTDLFVPAAYAVFSSNPRHEHGPLYAFSTTLLFATGFASVALGIARGALDAFIELAAAKTPRFGARGLRESAAAQSTAARAEADLRAARAFLHDAIRDAWEVACGGASLPVGQRAMLRLATTHAFRAAAGVVDAVYLAAGSSAIFTDNPFERRFRDIHAVTQQVQARPAHFETVGQFLFGAAPDSAFL